jgi:hypothetical protein
MVGTHKGKLAAREASCFAYLRLCFPLYDSNEIPRKQTIRPPNLENRGGKESYIIRNIQLWDEAMQRPGYSPTS